MMTKVAVLFAMPGSVYRDLDGVECYDAERDARTWGGGMPVVAHPPCRAWGKLRGLAKREPAERALGIWAGHQVRAWGGVLEQPCWSKLWLAAGLPLPGDRDELGGFTLDVDQFWWGHRAQKRTWLYVCGCDPAEVPVMPFCLGQAPRVLTNVHGLRVGMAGYRPEVSKRERSATPLALARWLVDLARLCAARRYLWGGQVISGPASVAGGPVVKQSGLN